MRRLSLSLFVSMTTVSIALAHEGPRIWIGNVDGKITTFRSDNDLDPTEYTPCRLFSTDMESLFGIYTTEFPGYEVRQVGGNVGGGTTFAFNITEPALFFDAGSNAFRTATQMFGPPEPGPVPQIALTLGANLRKTGDGAVSGFSFFTFTGVGDHSHLAYTLLGDGVTASDGPAGVYAISMNLTSSTLVASEPYYLLLGKDVEPDSTLFEQASEVARATLIGVGAPGDMDCNGAVGAGDTADFVTAILTATDGLATPACCSLRTADMNGDGLLDGRDIHVFAAVCTGG